MARPICEGDSDWLVDPPKQPVFDRDVVAAWKRRKIGIGIEITIGRDEIGDRVPPGPNWMPFMAVLAAPVFVTAPPMIPPGVLLLPAPDDDVSAHWGWSRHCKPGWATRPDC